MVPWEMGRCMSLCVVWWWFTLLVMCVAAAHLSLSLCVRGCFTFPGKVGNEWWINWHKKIPEENIILITKNQNKISYVTREILSPILNQFCLVETLGPGNVYDSNTKKGPYRAGSLCGCKFCSVFAPLELKEWPFRVTSIIRLRHGAVGLV